MLGKTLLRIIKAGEGDVFEVRFEPRRRVEGYEACDIITFCAVENLDVKIIHLVQQNLQVVNFPARNTYGVFCSHHPAVVIKCFEFIESHKIKKLWLVKTNDSRKGVLWNR